MADAITVSGTRTGSSPDFDMLAGIKSSVKLPVLVGGGLTFNNVSSFLTIADGAIVGTNLKVDGKTENPIDVTRVRRFMECD